MSKSTRRSRYYAMTFQATRPLRCRTCRTGIPTDSPAWSPFYRGGCYHLTCESSPVYERPPVTDPESLCPECRTEYRWNPDLSCCSRCWALRTSVAA